MALHRVPTGAAQAPVPVVGLAIGLVLIWLASTPLAAQGGMPAPCGTEAACRLPTGSYVVAPPPGWDGRARLRVAVFLHGFRSRGAEILADTNLVAAFHASGTLLVAPDGQDGRWAVPGTPGGAQRDDIAFIADVLADVERRFPVRQGETAAFGFSLGGSFVWTIACQRPTLFRHYTAFAGGFWRPHPHQCAPGRVDLVHIHGRGDATVPLAGRVIREVHRQGDIAEGLAFWRRSKGCRTRHQLAASHVGLECESADGCIGATAVTSCQHPGGHWVDARWVTWALGRIWPR